MLKWKRRLDLAEKAQKFVLIGLSSVVAIQYMMRLSESFFINLYAIKSGIFVFVATLVVTAIAYTVLLFFLQGMSDNEEKRERLAKARIVT